MRISDSILYPIPGRSLLPSVYRVWGVWILIAVMYAVVLSPALISIVWHIGNGSRVLWRENKFQLPLAWSVSHPYMAQRDELMLTRRSWFVFTSTASNTLFIFRANPKTMPEPDIESVKSAMAQNRGLVSSFSRSTYGSNFHCLSEPQSQPRFSLRYLPEIHAHCELDGASWTLEYYGSPTVLDEALAIIAQGQSVANP